MIDQIKKLTNPDSLVSLFLGIAVVVVTGMLIFNYAKNKQTEVTQVPTSQEQQNATASASLPATHVVQSGETLWSIAESTIGSGYNWIDIAKENKLTDPNDISAGEKLTIPNVTKIVPGQEVSSASVEVKRPADGKYTVQKGDSLWSISVAIYGTGYRWTEIATLNKLENPGVIYSGTVLTLP
jgi:nucleoid-associated protein YgaU